VKKAAGLGALPGLPASVGGNVAARVCKTTGGSDPTGRLEAHAIGNQTVAY
jgi:hypothetical protein